jgi:hypothetical protein
MFLRLAGIYRWLPFDNLNHYGFDGLAEDAGTLVSAGLLSVARSGKFCKLTAQGYRFLQERGCPCLTKNRRPYDNDPALRGRLETAAVMLTALRAGIDPLRDHADALRNQPVFLPAFVMRTGQGNLMNAASCIGLGHWGDSAYMIQYTGPDNHGMYLTNELTHFNNMASLFDGRRHTPMSLIFAGPDYKRIYERLQKRLPAGGYKGKGYVDFADVYRQAELPIHLLSCDETGARQLAVMMEPDYKSKIARAAFGGDWQPIDPGIPEADGCVNGNPLVIAVDMDLRRVERVIDAARRRGRRETMVAALQEQNRPFYKSILPKDGFVISLSIPPDVLEKAFGKPLSLYRMEREAAPVLHWEGLHTHPEQKADSGKAVTPSLLLNVFGIPARANLLHKTIFDHVGQHSLYGGGADIKQDIANFLF